MPILKGDITGDGFINEDDLNKVRLYSGTSQIASNYEEMMRCDLNEDGRINAVDAAILNDIIIGVSTYSYFEFDRTDSNSSISTRLNLARSAINSRYWTKYKCNINDIGEKIISFYDEKTKKDHIVYRYDLVTSEERKIIEDYDEYKVTKNEISYYEGIKMLKGDCNLNGELNQTDIDYINICLERNAEFSEIQKTIADMNNDNIIDERDVEEIKKILLGEKSMYDEWAK